MTFSAYNALGAVHVLDQLAEQHRTRQAQAGQQSDVEPAKVEQSLVGTEAGREILANWQDSLPPGVRYVSPEFFAAFRAELAKTKV